MTRRKRIIIGFLMVLTLFCIIPNTMVYAEGGIPPVPIGGGNSDGDESEDVSDTSNDWGPTNGRAGWLVTLCDDTGKPALGSQVAFFPYANSTTFAQSSAGAITTEFFEKRW